LPLLYLKKQTFPKRLLPGTIALGAFTATMDCLPGTPQIQKFDTNEFFFGTNIYAAPTLGLIGGILIFALGVTWLERRRRQAVAKGEGYGAHTLNEPEVKNDIKLPPLKVAIFTIVGCISSKLCYDASLQMGSWYAGTFPGNEIAFNCRIH
jgi:H+/gluconate symporter-like permease